MVAGLKPIARRYGSSTEKGSGQTGRADEAAKLLPTARRLSEGIALVSQQITRRQFDLNGFKAVNDVHGHPAGDLALEEVARRMLATVRSGDKVARFGGGEFAPYKLGAITTAKPQCLLVGLQEPGRAHV